MQAICPFAYRVLDFTAWLIPAYNLNTLRYNSIVLSEGNPMLNTLAITIPSLSLFAFFGHGGTFARHDVSLQFSIKDCFLLGRLDSTMASHVCLSLLWTVIFSPQPYILNTSLYNVPFQAKREVLKEPIFIFILISSPFPFSLMILDERSP
jgi:hypothetical protein